MDITLAIARHESRDNANDKGKSMRVIQNILA
jgi:hypothetical protein